MLTTEQQRDKEYMDQALDALIELEVGRLGASRFFPEKLTWRATNAYNLPGKDDSSDGRIKALSFAYVERRVTRKLRRAQNGLRLYIPIGGGQWQYAAATLARQVRVFGNNYAEIQQSADARRERIEEVLEQHEQLGFGLDDPITVAYEAALTATQESKAA